MNARPRTDRDCVQPFTDLASAARYSEGVIIYTDPIKGLMAEASVGGQKFTFTAIEP